MCQKVSGLQTQLYFISADLIVIKLTLFFSDFHYEFTNDYDDLKIFQYSLDGTAIDSV